VAEEMYTSNNEGLGGLKIGKFFSRAFHLKGIIKKAPRILAGAATGWVMGGGTTPGTILISAGAGAITAAIPRRRAGTSLLQDVYRGGLYGTIGGSVVGVYRGLTYPKGAGFRQVGAAGVLTQRVQQRWFPKSQEPAQALRDAPQAKPAVPENIKFNPRPVEVATTATKEMAKAGWLDPSLKFAGALVQVGGVIGAAGLQVQAQSEMMRMQLEQQAQEGGFVTPLGRQVAYDPNTGQYYDPATGAVYDPNTGQYAGATMYAPPGGGFGYSDAPPPDYATPSGRLPATRKAGLTEMLKSPVGAAVVVGGGALLYFATQPPQKRSRRRRSRR